MVVRSVVVDGPRATPRLIKGGPGGQLPRCESMVLPLHTDESMARSGFNLA